MKIGGGYSTIPISENLSLEEVVRTRHSIRNFDASPVDVCKLNDAIQLALCCPNACNRQPFKIYVIDSKKKEECIGSKNEFNADKYLIITGIISAFNIFEMNDWIVSASILAGYLSLTLHDKGIGSCIMRKELVVENSYNRGIRELCSIPNTEQIVLEMAIGNYRPETKVPVSKRKEDISEICTYVQ